jgi:C4-dicarboxylate-specific signal transduction histidine kinase
MVRGDSVQCAGRALGEHRRKRAQEGRERLRQQEADLKHMNRLSMMGALAASLAHELAQPIAATRNNVQAAAPNFLAKSPPDLAEIRQALGCVVADADRAGDIMWPCAIRGQASIRVISSAFLMLFYTTKCGGMGMGLSICRSIIANHGVRLWAEANEPRGAVFQFSMPSAEGSALCTDG